MSLLPANFSRRAPHDIVDYTYCALILVDALLILLLLSGVTLEGLYGFLTLSDGDWDNSSRPEVINALAACCSAVVTIALAFIAWIQLGQIASQQRYAATLQICDRYDFDPALTASYHKLYCHVTGLKLLEPVELDATLTTTFNYFSSVAIGIRRGLYDMSIAHEHLASIVSFWMGEIDKSADPQIVKFREDFEADYGLLCRLCRYWLPEDETWLNNF